MNANNTGNNPAVLSAYTFSESGHKINPVAEDADNKDQNGTERNGTPPESRKQRAIAAKQHHSVIGQTKLTPDGLVGDQEGKKDL